MGWWTSDVEGVKGVVVGAQGGGCVQEECAGERWWGERGRGVDVLLRTCVQAGILLCYVRSRGECTV